MTQFQLLCKADVNGVWRMDLPIEFEDVANVKNEQEFNASWSEDEMSDRESGK